MESGFEKAIAIVGLGAILPDAPDVSTFWDNIKKGRYSISDVTADRWDPALYYDPDPSTPDKAYSKIGGWVRQFVWDPLKWRLPIPPRVAEAMDDTQKWAIACTREALEDFGYSRRPLDHDRTAVILGNAMGGEHHYLTILRLYFPEYARELAGSASFAVLPDNIRKQITSELRDRIEQYFPNVTEDTMPGELSNCVAGRIANLFNFHGPNFVVDAACASAMAAFTAAAEGLIDNQFDIAVTGGIDRNMGASTFIKFSKIGALSATGTRPYAEGADGFVMGEGAAIFLLKRLSDAERDQDKIYAVLRGIAGSSDGKGKGITAPNPVGQKLCIERAWKNAGLSPATVTMIEGHGTSTRVGDVVEVQSFAEVLKECSLTPQSVALGSVKSNFGHLKGAAGAAGLLKTVLSLHHKTLPPSIHCDRPNPDIDFSQTPLYVNRTLKPWEAPEGVVRRAGVSAFGFGGTNFHAVLEEYLPGHGNGKRSTVVHEEQPREPFKSSLVVRAVTPENGLKIPLRGALVIGSQTLPELINRLRSVEKEALGGRTPKPDAPSKADLRAPERTAIDYGDAAELADKCARVQKALMAEQTPIWKALRAQGIFRGQGPAAKVAFLYPGQGSQYINMMRALRDIEPIVASTFDEADEVMMPLLGKQLSQFFFVDQNDAPVLQKAEEDLKQTAITQPAVLACDLAITRLLAAYGIEPDMTMGHSLGEYGALVASGAMPFKDALEAVSARGREMTRVAMADNGRMAAVFAPLPEIDRILKTLDGYVVIANVNSKSQAVIGGASKAVERAIEIFLQAGFNAVPLPVSHAFHTSIVAPASEPLKAVLRRMHLQSPQVPVIANVSGNFYPMGPEGASLIVDILGQQIASPVNFVKGLHTLYEAGARIFVEVGPKKALQGFADDVLGSDPKILSLFTNHPKFADAVAFNQALCGMYAAGLGRGVEQQVTTAASGAEPVSQKKKPSDAMREKPVPQQPKEEVMSAQANATTKRGSYDELGRYFAEVMERGWQMYKPNNREAANAPVVITGAALGLPGIDHIFDDNNLARILRGEQLIQPIPGHLREAMLNKHIRRLVKSDNGGPVFETINEVGEVIKLAGRGGQFDLEKEFGVAADRVATFDRCTALAIASGVDALRDAGIPLVLRYKTTSKGTQLPDRWGLPDAMRDDTGVIFASAFPGLNSFCEETHRYYNDRARREQLAMLEGLAVEAVRSNGNSAITVQIANRTAELRAQIESEPYMVDRRFLLRILSMGHSQFAELIGARGPNTQLNAACASTTQALSVAEDWINAGRCRRVVIISADDITSDSTMGWFGAGFLASGAAATDEAVEEAAVPFDKRRHGLIVGMGAAAIVVESAEAARERGLQPICELLSAVTANSAFHATRLDVQHIGQLMETLIGRAEVRHGISRSEIADRTVFVSHETYTPARGGSASAEIHSLRKIFGEAADKIVIANTKGYTGHAMATGIEDVLAVKTLETGVVPPVANFKEVDPELGQLNLSHGGSYPVEFALRLGAGFGSQISMALLRWVPTKEGVRRAPDALGYEYRINDPEAWKSWITRISHNSSAELVVDHRTLRVRPEPANAKNVVSVAAVAEQMLPKLVPAKQSTPELVPTVETKKTTVVASTPSHDEIKQNVLAMVSEKTGYPVDMLDPDLDLEADLGVDTVKQAEVFAAVRERYGIQRDEKLRLRDFPTLAHVVRFVEERTTAVHETEPKSPDVITVEATESAPPGLPATPADDEVKTRVLRLVAEKTGYPIDMLDLDLDMEADLGVDTVKQAEAFAAIREVYSIPPDPNLKLRDFPTLAHVIRFVNERPTDAVVYEVASKVPESEIKIPAEPAIQGASTERDSDHAVQDRILELVVEKTGYPQEMLDLDLDLEADLGIDTVKQAELFASIRQIYGIEREQNLKLRDFPTLKDVINFVYQKRPDLAWTTRAAETPTAATTANEVSVADPVPKELALTPITLVDDQITNTVLAIAADKTGYPIEMLALDLDLEADLGIDTVKQAEMFASVRQAFGIPRSENLKLRDFPTLAAVINFAKSKGTQTSERESEPVKTVTADSLAVTTVARKTGGFEASNRIPRRVPVPSLRPSLNLCKQTGITLGVNTRVVLMPDKAGVAEGLEASLRSRGVTVLKLRHAEDPQPAIRTWLNAGPIHGIYWLPALDDHAPLAQMDPSVWKDELHVRVKALYRCMRALYNSIAQKNTFLITATRLGGQHGYDDTGATVPMDGAVVGFTKSYKRERTEVLVKAVDFAKNGPASEVADALIGETLHDPGVVEIAYKSGLRWTIQLEEQPPLDTEHAMMLNENTVFVITGAAGSIVSAITADLATASGGVFYLLDLVPQPDPNDPDLQRLTTDKDALKRDIFARIQKRGERATPALVEKELARLERARAALDAIQAITTAGGKAQYRGVDLRDSNGVADVIEEIRQKFGRIDVLLHAAGMERSHFLPEKEPAEFDLVFDVKADGFFNLLHAIGDMPLGVTVVFSSIAGRFGNAGQTDYSAANDLLCKITSSLRNTHPKTRAIAIDWTAWKDIGMASRGSIPKMMELAGIDMITPEAAVPVVRRELTCSNFSGEVLIAEGLGGLVNEWDASGGVEPAAVSEQLSTIGPMAGNLAALPINGELKLEASLDPKTQPFLYDHQIDGTPVLPGVMGVEAFAEAALSLVPGWCIDQIEDVDFSSALKFYRSEPRTVSTHARFRAASDHVLADCSLIGTRLLPGKSEPQVTTHFTGRVRLANSSPISVTSSCRPVDGPVEPVVDAKNIYQVYFHGPAYQVIARAWRDGDRMIGQMAANLPPNYSPADRCSILEPRMIELCFQTAGLWEITVEGRMGLPQHVDRITCWRTKPHPGATLFAIVSPDERHGVFNAEVIDSEGNAYCEVVGYRTVTWLTDVDATPLKWLQAVAA